MEFYPENVLQFMFQFGMEKFINLHFINFNFVFNKHWRMPLKFFVLNYGVQYYQAGPVTQSV